MVLSCRQQGAMVLVLLIPEFWFRVLIFPKGDRIRWCRQDATAMGYWGVDAMSYNRFYRRW
jgi:hypothetical protein